MGGAVDVPGAGLMLGLVAAGAASGLVPVINAEAVLTAAAATRPDLGFQASVSITIGQCAAKVLIYLTAREGPQRLNHDGRASRLVNRVRSVIRRHRPTATTSPGRAHLQRERFLGLLGEPLAGTSVV